MDVTLPWIEAALIATCIVTLGYAAYSDIRHLEVANSVSILLGTLFFPAAWSFGFDIVTVGVHVAVAIGMLALGFVLFSLGLTGGADAKLLAAASLWVGIDGLGRLLIYMALIGGLLAILVLIARGLSTSAIAGKLPWLIPGRWRDAPIPYCVAISIATVLSLPSAGLIPRLFQDAASW